MRRKFTVHFPDDSTETFYGSAYKIEDGVLEIRHIQGKKVYIVPVENFTWVKVELAK